MRTLVVRGYGRVAVAAEDWADALAVVTRGRVQLELRDGSAGPVLGPDSCFWLRDTGVRALLNPGPRTATLRVVTPGHSTSCPGATAMTTYPRTTSHAHPYRRVAGAGLLAVAGAVAATGAVATVARALGADFVVSGGEIPASGAAFVAGVFSLVGVVLALAFLRWSSRPAEHFLRTTLTLTALSLVPPFLSGGDAGTIAGLVSLHLVTAAVMIPALTRALGSVVDHVRSHVDPRRPGDQGSSSFGGSSPRGTSGRVEDCLLTGRLRFVGGR